MAELKGVEKHTIEEAKQFAQENNVWRGYLVPISDYDNNGIKIPIVIHALLFGEEYQYVVTKKEDMDEFVKLNDVGYEDWDFNNQVMYTLQDVVDYYKTVDSHDFELFGANE
ncbi:hypothetical protein COF68_05710 [Bacillus toyonensis]|uniref:hypothetical protein n=1 Tax=Bacillus toyonensis TaxID=155322 RepID=UPI000BFBFB60|nr:hypothetical protein [Bacillus toyonensis]PHE64336.1 hypothetical protein COF68_05710 [Bacillus toyonensis]